MLRRATSWELDPWKDRTGAYGSSKITRIPGHIIIPTPDMRLHSNRHLTGLNRDWTREKSHHDLQVWHTQQREILDDTNGNLGQGNLMIDWSYHSIGFRGFHRWTDSERWFPSSAGHLEWTSRMNRLKTQTISVQSASPTRARVYRCQLGMVFEGQYALAHHTTGYRCVCAKTSLLHHITERDHVWVSMIRGFRPPDFSEIYGNRVPSLESKPASRTRHHSRYRLDSPATATLAESYATCPICKRHQRRNHLCAECPA